jgi:hypothetical protein
MLGLQDNLCAAFGVTAIHTAVWTCRKRLETDAKLAADKVTREVLEISWR